MDESMLISGQLLLFYQNAKNVKVLLQMQGNDNS